MKFPPQTIGPSVGADGRMRRRSRRWRQRWPACPRALLSWSAARARRTALAATDRGWTFGSLRSIRATCVLIGPGELLGLVTDANFDELPAVGAVAP